MNAPRIVWEEDFDHGFYCKVLVPRTWLMERSRFKRQLQMWLWLTRLVWTLPHE